MHGSANMYQLYDALILVPTTFGLHQLCRILDQSMGQKAFVQLNGGKNHEAQIMTKGN